MVWIVELQAAPLWPLVGFGIQRDDATIMIIGKKKDATQILDTSVSLRH